MRPRSVSDEEILDAARLCLIARGPATTVDEIGRRLGVSGPAILKRFGTKENLVFRALTADAHPDLSQGPGPGPLRPQLVAALLQIERAVRQVVPRLATIRAGCVSASELMANAPPRAARRRVRAWLEQARESHGLTHPDLDSAADLLVSLVEARAFLIWMEPTWVDDGDDWAARAVDALFGATDQTSDVDGSTSGGTL